MTNINQINYPDDWKVRKIEDYLKITGGSTPSTKVEKFWNGDLVWLTPSDITSNGSIYISNSKRRITKEGLQSCSAKLMPSYSVLITSRATIGAVAINKAPAATNQGFINIYPDEKYSTEYLAYWILRNKNILEENAKGSTFKEISKGVFKTLSIPFPPLQEQKKIAGVLSTVQEAIEKTENVIKAAKELKKSLMQHLFTYGPVPVNEAEGIELKETEVGKIPVGWGLLKLGDLVNNSFGGGTPSTKENEYWKGSIPWTTSAIIDATDVYLDNYLKKITKLGLEKSSSNVVEMGNLLVGTRVGVGKAVVNKINIAINQDLTALILDKEKVMPLFLAWYFKTSYIKEWFERNKRGATIKGVPRDDLLSLKAPLPPIGIQEEIIESLTVLNEKIKSEKSKKFALEKLFNSLLDNFMTAKIRVKDLEDN